MFRNLNNQRGFTFIEVVLTTTVLSIAMWGGLAVFNNATANNLQNDYRVMASELANEKLELVTADKAFRGYDWVVANDYADETFDGVYSSFHRSTTITEVSSNNFNAVIGTAGSGYMRVDALVSWGDGASQRIVMSTILSNY